MVASRLSHSRINPNVWSRMVIEAECGLCVTEARCRSRQMQVSRSLGVRMSEYMGFVGLAGGLGHLDHPLIDRRHSDPHRPSPLLTRRCGSSEYTHHRPGRIAGWRETAMDVPGWSCQWDVSMEGSSSAMTWRGGMCETARPARSGARRSTPADANCCVTVLTSPGSLAATLGRRP